MRRSAKLTNSLAIPYTDNRRAQSRRRISI